jgi:hypothetical protein
MFLSREILQLTGMINCLVKNSLPNLSRQVENRWIKFIGKPYWFSRSNVKVTVSNCLLCNILVNTLESTSFNGFWPNLVHKSIGFHILLRTRYVPRLVKIHWRMLILECSHGCYRVKIQSCDLDLWPWKSKGFQILLRTKFEMYIWMLF